MLNNRSLKFRYTKTKKIPKGFNVKVGEVPKFKLWKWQNEAYAGFWNSDGYYIINALMASGKGTAIKGIALGALEKEYKVLIVTPNGFIGDNFSSEENILNKKWYTWEVLEENNFCDNIKNKCIELGRWCKRNPLKDKAYNIALCNFPTFVKNFKNIKENTLVIIDEMHHICMEDENHNNLGKAIKYCVKKEIKILGCTATPFRGDSYTIIDSKYLEKFETYRLDAVKYFGEVTQYINGFDYNIYFTERDSITAIQELCKDHIGKLIISMPSGNARHSPRYTGEINKKEEIEKIVKAIFGNFKYTKDNVLMKAKRKGKTYTILDLVEDNGLRQKRREYLKNNKDKIDIIINIDVFSEGADWPEANRMIVCGDRGSITKKFQNEGRVLRDHPSKKNNPPIIEHVIPYLNLKDENEENIREVANSLLVVTYQSMIMEYLYSPCKSKIQTKNGNDILVKEYLFDELTEQGFMKLLDDITNDIFDNNIEGNAVNFNDIIIYRLEERELRTDNEVIGFIRMEWKKANKDLIDDSKERKPQKVKKSVKVNKIPIDIDIVNEIEFLEGIYKVSDFCRVKNLKEFAKLIRGHAHSDLIRVEKELIPWLEKKNDISIKL